MGHCFALVVAFDLVMLDCLPHDFYRATHEPDKLGCFSQCLKGPSCLSLAYKVDTGRCFLFSTKLQSTNNTLAGQFLAYNARNYETEMPLHQKECPSELGYTYDSAINVCYNLYSDLKPNSGALAHCLNDGARGFIRVDTPQKQVYFITLMPATKWVAERYKCVLACQDDDACAAIVFKLDTRTCFFFNEKLTSSTNTLEGDFLAYNTRRSSVSQPQKDCPTTNGYQYNSDINVCYKYYSDTIANADAKARCKADGARGFVRVDTEEKQNFFKTRVPVSNTWAHVAGKYVSNAWTYEKENPYDCQIEMPYLNWAGEQGNPASNQPCVTIGQDALHDGFCTNPRHSICEM